MSTLMKNNKTIAGLVENLKSIKITGTTTASGNLGYNFDMGVPICCINDSNTGTIIEPYCANGAVIGFHIITNGGQAVASTAVSFTVYYL